MTDAASRRVRATLLAAMCVVAAAAATPAGAATGDRAQAAAVMRSLDRLSARRATLTAQLGRARVRVAGLSQQLAQARLQERIDRANLGATRRLLAAALVGQYKSGGIDPALLVFSAGSFADIVERIDTLNRVGSSEREAILDIVAGAARVRADAAVTARRRAGVAAELTALRHERAAVDAAIAARRRLLDSITARIRRQLAAEQRRRAQLARQTTGDPGPAGGASPTGGSSAPAGGGSTSFSGDVTWYGPGFAGQPTADGEIFDPTKLTAASPWLPFNTMLRVTSTVTGRSVVVRVNDRGPFGHGVLDLSAHAAQVIGLSGWQRCRLVVLS